jgi:hypothetical protein
LLIIYVTTTATDAANNNKSDGITPITYIEIANNKGVKTPNTDNHTTCLAMEINNHTKGKRSTRVRIQRGKLFIKR